MGDAVRKLPELVMETPTVQIFRPFLNRWLGGFTGESTDEDTTGIIDVGSDGQLMHHPSLDNVCTSVLGEGVVLHADSLGEEHSQGAASTELVACVVKDDGDH